MKNLMSIIIVFFAFLITCQSYAELRREDLNNRIEIREEQQLMNQVDIVSLYLTSENVAWEPRLIDNKIEIDITILSQRLINDPNLLEDFVSRQIAIFKRELLRRLQTYAPTIALHFDQDSDVIFIIREKANNRKIAEVRDGNWYFAVNRSGFATKKDSYSKDPSVLNNTEKKSYNSNVDNNNVGKKPCNCPALVGKK